VYLLLLVPPPTLPQAVQEAMGCTFKYAMIDKSPMEMSVLDKLGIMYLLCLFHKLQEWERFLRSAESGAKSQDRLQMLHELKELATTTDKAVFEFKQQEFIKK
jgi:hypothetical protein